MTKIVINWCNYVQSIERHYVGNYTYMYEKPSQCGVLNA